jgi:hypothetical protein
MPARKLAQKAGGLLKGLRSKQSLRRRGKGQDNNGGSKVVTDVPSEQDPNPPVDFPETRPPVYATAASAKTALGKRRRYSTRSMSQQTITIHEDATAATTRLRRSSKMSTTVPQVDLFDQDSDSTESDEEVDETVIEDMRRLEENFAGISQRYRLVNRIGEGMQIPHVSFGP